MQTDIPLKRLTLLCAADLLPLFGFPHAALLGVDSLELPASGARLDNVLRVQSPGGQAYLHVVEWQGYRDPTVLWRMTGYLAWLGQRSPGQAVVGTLVFLTPEADVGDRLTQVIDGAAVSDWPVHCVRLWEHEAREALAAGSLGLAVLSPLMRHADRSVVEDAAEMVLDAEPSPEQADLLSILGVFAEPVISPEDFARMIGKERLMESKLLEYLAGEKIAIAVTEAEQRTRVISFREGLVEGLQRTLEEIVVARFPQAPLILLHKLRQVDDPAQLEDLTSVALHAQDASEIEERLRSFATKDVNGSAAGGT